MNDTTTTAQPATIDELASFYKACGEALRLNILRVLSTNSFGVLELAHIFSVGQSGISHHLKILSQAGLVTSRREGNAIFYRRSSQQQNEPLHACLFGQLDLLPVEAAITQRIDEIHLERASTSAAYFQRIGHDFDQNQELIAGIQQYADSLTALLDSLSGPRDLAIEVGPGNGRFLPVLSQRYARVLAVDNSQCMLQQAREYCRQQELANIEFVLADALQQQLPAADCLILNMVLHHLPAPTDAIARLSQALRPGGNMIISELCRHDQDWAQQACGDLWLGFEQQELGHWAMQAGLIPGQPVFLGLKNGFQIQLRQFAKATH